MGISDLLKYFSSGNFGLIARNITYIYYRVINDFRDKFESPEDMIVAVGIIDTYKYFERGQINQRDIMVAMALATEGKCGINNYFILHDPKQCSGDELDFLVNYVMQLEVLMFRVDTTMDDKKIVDSVIKMKSQIEKSVQDVVRDFKYGKANNKKLDDLIELFFRS